MLPDDELSQIRADLEQTLPDVGTLLTVSRTSDGMGGWSESWGTAGTVACRIDAIGGRESVTAGALLPYQKFTLTVPQSCGLTSQHRFGCSYGTFTIGPVSTGSWIGVKRATLEKV